jgi:hypothetical protein
MSELIQKDEIRNIRWKLLAEVSALALIGYATTISVAMGEDGDRPTVWIELGGQLSRWEGGQEAYTPPFVALTPSNLTPPQEFAKQPRYGMDENATLIFQPHNSDWTFSGSIRYGRSSNAKHVHQQSHPGIFTAYSKHHTSYGTGASYHTNLTQVRPIAARFADTVSKQSQTHAVVDFQAGKDLGIGLFSHDTLSTLNVGVRFAQFTSNSSIKLGEGPDWEFKTLITTYGTAFDYGGQHITFHRTRQNVHQPYHSFAGTFRADRSFDGLGPSIAWKSSMPLIGHPEASELTFDWGVNAALLFGRQKAKTHHQTTERYSPGGFYGHTRTTLYDFNHASATRSRGVVVPNIGGFAGLSFKYTNAKVSFGYKADFFFGAMDGGIDVRHAEDIGFHGPFASVSVGLGG